MKFSDFIFSLVWALAEWFWQLYYESQDIPIVGSVLSTIFLAIYRVVWGLLTPIAQFGDWVNDVSTKVSNILSQADILSLLRTWLTYAENAWSWVINAWQNVTSIINIWWSSASQVVHVWIQTLGDELKSYINNILSVVNSLTVAWDSFKGKLPSLDEVILWWGNRTANVLSVVNTWWRERLLEISSLINSAFIARQDFWQGWQDWRAKVTEFFTDPEDWLYKAFDRIIDRFW